jgi:ClpP class serine protease
MIEAVGLIVNSNGGSAVHSELISSSIKQFCEINKLKLFTFAENYAVSGGYWILCVGDEVYANPASIIGSIGVIFGTVDLKSLLERRNISRRYFTSKNDDKRYIFE